MRPNRRVEITWMLFVLMMTVGASQAFAQPEQVFVVRGFQLNGSSPLVLEGDLIGANAIWQPLASPIQGSTTETIPSGPGFNGATCRKEFRQAQILTQDGSTLTVHVYDTRCEPYSSSGIPNGAYSANGVYSVQGGTGKFAGFIGGTGA
jgi:hypothetical protein